MGKHLDSAKVAAEILKLGAEVYDLITSARKKNEENEHEKRIKNLEEEIKRLKDK